MPAVLKTETFVMNEGETRIFVPAAWAVAGHIVNVYAEWLAPIDSKNGKVPHFYMILFDSFTVANVTTVYEYSSAVSVGAGVALSVLRNDGVRGSIQVYVRRNGRTTPATIRLRQINFSVP